MCDLLFRANEELFYLFNKMYRVHTRSASFVSMFVEFYKTLFLCLFFCSVFFVNPAYLVNTLTLSHSKNFQDIHLLDFGFISNTLSFICVRHCSLVDRIDSMLFLQSQKSFTVSVCMCVCRLKDRVLPAAMSLRPVVSLYIPPRTLPPVLGGLLHATVSSRCSLYTRDNRPVWLDFGGFEEPANISASQ